MSAAGWRRAAGVGVAIAGAAAAAAAGGLAAQRTIAARRAGRGEAADLGSLHAAPHTVVADDGVPLHVEVDEPDHKPATGAPTLVFIHGYTLDLDCWHFQRAGLRGEHRMVFYDQRSHGRSGRSSADNSTLEQLGRDLAAVLEAEVPTGPLVLIGHSMGGMSLLAWAEQHPDIVGQRVAGVALLATSSGAVGKLLPGGPGRMLDRAQPLVAAALARVPWLVETGRRSTAFALTRQLAFGGDVPDSYVLFVDQMISQTPSDVIWEFYPSIRAHERAHVLASFGAIPALVVGGGNDHVLPVAHSERIAEALPAARLIRIEGAGHMLILEAHAEVSSALADLVVAAATPKPRRVRA